MSGTCWGHVPACCFIHFCSGIITQLYYHFPRFLEFWTCPWSTSCHLLKRRIKWTSLICTAHCFSPHVSWVCSCVRSSYAAVSDIVIVDILGQHHLFLWAALYLSHTNLTSRAGGNLQELEAKMLTSLLITYIYLYLLIFSSFYSLLISESHQYKSTHKNKTTKNEMLSQNSPTPSV